MSPAKPSSRATLAIEWAHQSVTPEDVTYLRDVTAKMKAAAQALNLAQFYENDLAFHRKFWAMSGIYKWVRCVSAQAGSLATRLPAQTRIAPSIQNRMK